MQPLPQPGPAHRKHKTLASKLSDCIHYIKSPEGGGFKTFGDFMTGLFTGLPTDGSSSSSSEYQTVIQTVRAFLSWNPLKGFLDKVSSHAVMTTSDGDTQGIVPFYCISPGLPTPEGMVFLLCWGCS